MIKLLKNINKKQIPLVLICFILIIAQVWLELKLPDYMSEITILVQTQGSKMTDILINGGYMLLCAARKLNISNYSWIFGIKNISYFFNEY